MLHTRILGGALFLAGMVLMTYNLIRTIRSGKPATATVEVLVPDVPAKEGMSLVAGFINPPVIYSFLLVLFACGWGFGQGLLSTVSLVLLVETALVAMIHLGLSGKKWNDWYERLLESWLPFTVLTFVAVIAGGLIQILPTVFVKQNPGTDAPLQKVYPPPELAGRDIYHCDLYRLRDPAELDELGMGIDFRTLKEAVKVIMDDLDHRDLNEHSAFRDKNPSSENIAAFIFHALEKDLRSERYHLHAIMVGETDNTGVIYRGKTQV